MNCNKSVPKTRLKFQQTHSKHSVTLTKSVSICIEAIPDLVPQVFWGAADVSVEVRHVDELCDAGFSGCPGNLLWDGNKHVLKAKVPSQKEVDRKNLK